MTPAAITIVYQLCAPILAIAAVIGFYVNAVSARSAAKVGRELGQKLDDLNRSIAGLSEKIAISEVRHEELDRRVTRLEVPIAPAITRA